MGAPAAKGYTGPHKVDMGARRRALPDDQETKALDRAGEALERFGPGPSRSLAAVAISEWICARTAMGGAGRLDGRLMFNLGDAQLRGYIEASLPAIGGALAHLPADVPLFELTRDQISDVIVAAVQAVREAMVVANEDLGFPFSDTIPFGDS